MNRKIIIYILIALVVVPVFGQKTAKEIKGDRLYHNFYFNKALKYYEKVDRLTIDGIRNFVDCYLKVRDFVHAEEILLTLVGNSESNADDILNYVRILKHNGKYTVADKWMEKYARLRPDELRTRSFLSTRQSFSLLLGNTSNSMIKDLDFNNKEQDFGPAYWGDKIVFASSRGVKVAEEKLYNWNQKNFLNLYAAEVSEGQLVKLEKFNKKVNQKWHEGAASFFEKGSMMAFTRDNYQAKSQNQTVNLELYFSKYDGNKWSNPSSFYLNNKEYSVGHPSVSEDGSTLYFASNMPGGYGGVDIYCVKKLTSGEWCKAVNMGPNVNTEGDEMFPFYEESSKTLFFASDGHYGLGGLDIYSVTVKEDKTGKARNIGVPINGSEDDFALIIDKSLSNGYFTSNRQSGKGDDDIYSFIANLNRGGNTLKHVLQILDRNSGKPIRSASVKYSDNVNLVSGVDGITSRVVSADEDMAVDVDAFAYEPVIKNLDLHLVGADSVLSDTVWMNMQVGQKIVLKNIYYDYDKWDILPESAEELDKLVILMSANPDMKLELGSHTDSRGAEEYNRKLSQLRAESAKAYLVSSGIEADRIMATGYGESQLLNQCTDGKECLPAEHRQNRRTEVIIPGLTKGIDVKQEKGDYIDGSKDHDASYSSFKKHGSIFKQTIESAPKPNKQVENRAEGSASLYYINIMATDKKADAEKLIAKLSGKGFNAGILKESKAYVQKPIYRVRIICHSLEEVNQVLPILKNEYNNPWIEKVE